MRNLYKVATVVMFIMMTISANAQGTYFSETMTDTTNWKTIVKPVAPWSEASLTLASGVWKLYGAYWSSGPTGLCTGNIGICRSLKDAGTGATVSYVITPTLLHGVGTVSIIEGSAKAVKHEIFYSTDNGTTWTSTGLLTSTATACQTQTVTINQKTANKVKISNAGGTGGDANLNLIQVTSTDPLSVKAEANEKVTSFKLGSYPNPFNPSTKVTFEIPTSSNINLSVYNMLGEKVATLHEGFVPAGAYSTQFNALNLTSGMYIVRLQADKTSISKKIMLLK